MIPELALHVDDVRRRLDALQRAAEGLPLARLNLRLRAQRQVSRREPVDTDTMDVVLAACCVLSEEIVGGR
jgi:hypothetical protein